MSEIELPRNHMFYNLNTIFFMADKIEAGHYVYCTFITKNGIRIYPKKGKKFRFWVSD